MSTDDQHVYEAQIEEYEKDPTTGQYKRKWTLMLVSLAKRRNDVKARCKECHAPVKLMEAGPNNIPRAHAEHFKKFEGCSLSMAYKGVRSPNPDAIE